MRNAPTRRSNSHRARTRDSDVSMSFPFVVAAYAIFAVTTFVFWRILSTQLALTDFLPRRGDAAVAVRPNEPSLPTGSRE